MQRRIAKSLLMGIVLACTLGASSAAWAFPPGATGIDLTTVLTLDDRARRAINSLDGVPAAHEPLMKVRTIVIDPGHGGENSGAVGVAGIREKFLTLELAYQLRDQLQARHPEARVLLTRYWDRDMSLTERVHFANTIGADLFLSLHYNAAVHNRALGYETYFLKPSEATPGEQQVTGQPIATAANVVTGIDKPDDRPAPAGTASDAMMELQRDLERARQHQLSGVLAETVQSRLRRQLDSIDRGVKQANFGVLRGALMPAVVVEAAFLTHPDEGEVVTEPAHRTRIVEALVGAIEAFDARLEAVE